MLAFRPYAFFGIFSGLSSGRSSNLLYFQKETGGKHAFDDETFRLGDITEKGSAESKAKKDGYRGMP
jgi:hypothetical protein